MSAVNGRFLGVKICQALGLNPNEVVDLTVHCGLNEVATVTVEYLPQVSESDQLVRVFRAYRLVADE